MNGVFNFIYNYGLFKVYVGWWKYLEQVELAYA